MDTARSFLFAALACDNPPCRAACAARRRRHRARSLQRGYLEHPPAPQGYLLVTPTAPGLCCEQDTTVLLLSSLRSASQRRVSRAGPALHAGMRVTSIRPCAAEACFVAPTSRRPARALPCSAGSTICPRAAGVAGRPCTAEGCTKYPRDDKQSKSGGIYCGEHKLPGVAGAMSERCERKTRERCPASSDTWAAGPAGALRRGARRRARRRAARARWRCGYTWTAPRAAARR